MSAYPTPTNRPRVTRVKKVVRETEVARTIIFEDGVCRSAKPGQFIMVWAPGADEMPMSLSLIDEDGDSGVTVKPWGPGSTQLCNAKPGDLIGVRGPYGNGFTPVDGSVLLVGGGTGLAPLIPLSKALVKRGAKVTLVMAGRSKTEFLLVRNAKAVLSNPPHRLVFITDDGSLGMKGQAPDAVAAVLKEASVDMIYACGPEAMVRKVFDLAEEKGVLVQASLERIVKCSVGLCGICSIGRYLLCRDGPVFTSSQLREVSDEFGIYRRDESGRPMPLHPS